MKNITIKIISVSLSLLMIATLFSACGSKGDNDEITRNNQVIAKPEDSTEPVFGDGELTSGETTTGGETTTAGSGLNLGAITTRPSTTAPTDNSSSDSPDFSAIAGILGNVDPAVLAKFVNDMGFQYDSSQGIFYSGIDSWQRDSNYFSQYDMFAQYANMRYLTDKIDFTYDGLDWRIQLWKGQYGAFGGAEIGVYTKYPGTNEKVYKCANDDQLLNMRYDLYLSKSDYESGVRYFYRDEWTGKGHWWITGFKPGAVNIKELVLKGQIRMQTRTMANAFEAALLKAGFGKSYDASSLEYDTYYRHDTEFYFLWFALGEYNFKSN